MLTHAILPLMRFVSVFRKYAPTSPERGELSRNGHSHCCVFLRCTTSDRECFLDLRPYMNMSPISVQEEASVGRCYEIFRTLGLRFLPVVNRHNQVVGTITRTDLSGDSLAHNLLVRGHKQD